MVRLTTICIQNTVPTPPLHHFSRLGPHINFYYIGWTTGQNGQRKDDSNLVVYCSTNQNGQRKDGSNHRSLKGITDFDPSDRFIIRESVQFIFQVTLVEDFRIPPTVFLTSSNLSAYVNNQLIL
jgi:hypothetical protein